MKDSINFYYNLSISEVENWGAIYRFQMDGQYFYFVPFKRTQNELNDILLISKELKAKKIDVHDILFNKFGKVMTGVSNQNYVLLRPIGDIYEEFDLFSMIKLNDILILNSTKSGLYRNSWAELWSSKIDYFEYQVHELGKSKSLILDTFSYYVGLGENAISYVNITTSKYNMSFLDKITLSHKRIAYPNYKLNYFNPINFIFDLEVRDLAEYIKSAFFVSEDAFSILKELLKIKKFSIYSYHLLYARLLYPSYYFDIYEQIMNFYEKEDVLIPIIEKAEEYEKFLANAYFEISKYVSLERIEWLLESK